MCTCSSSLIIISLPQDLNHQLDTAESRISSLQHDNEESSSLLQLLQSQATEVGATIALALVHLYLSGEGEPSATV